MVHYTRPIPYVNKRMLNLFCPQCLFVIIHDFYCASFTLYCLVANEDYVDTRFSSKKANNITAIWDDFPERNESLIRNFPLLWIFLSKKLNKVQCLRNDLIENKKQQLVQRNQIHIQLIQYQETLSNICAVSIKMTSMWLFDRHECRGHSRRMTYWIWVSCLK